MSVSHAGSQGRFKRPHKPQNLGPALAACLHALHGRLLAMHWPRHCLTCSGAAVEPKGMTLELSLQHGCKALYTHCQWHPVLCRRRWPRRWTARVWGCGAPRSRAAMCWSSPLHAVPMASASVQEALAQEVDSSRMGLWGTSFAGGHVLVKGAELADDWRIRAIVSQAGRPRCCAAGKEVRIRR